jgi:hypothetical protein
MQQGATVAPQDLVLSGREVDAKKVGVITSVAALKSKTFALAYLKCKQKGEQVPLLGKQFYVNGQPAKVRSCASDSQQLVDLAVLLHSALGKCWHPFTGCRMYLFTDLCVQCIR